MTHTSIEQQIAEAWNAQADEYNQWDELDLGEKIEWAAKWLLKCLADVVADGEQNVNVYQESFTAIHKSVGRKLFVDVDFDNVGIYTTVARMKDFINQDAVKILETRGGFHVIIRLDEIEEKYVKSWYKNITSLPGADIAGDTLIPIPGTYQGGFVPRLFDMGKFL